MSHSHIRVCKPLPPRKPWLERTFIVTYVLLVAVVFLFIWWDRPHEPNIVTEGKILATRIVVDNIRHTRFGGRVDYRLEAHVSYDLNGSPQDRWLTADTVGTSRETIAAQIDGNPRNCLVYWRPNHPESARCQLQP
jgi:hypothetical protein